ncbi:hypothetical protein [Clostridium novyi]|uniref:hypothetical protein n=1 Tax=Clostridium novyi TaxID=1542 RepID=UPI000A5CE981|nr:hypothetical protein [Clostridium novyi]
MEWKTGVLTLKEIELLMERKNPQDYDKLMLPISGNKDKKDITSTMQSDIINIA